MAHGNSDDGKTIRIQRIESLSQALFVSRIKYETSNPLAHLADGSHARVRFVVEARNQDRALGTDHTTPVRRSEHVRNEEKDVLITVTGYVLVEDRAVDHLGHKH